MLESVGRYVTDLQGGFFNWASPENVSRLAPPKNASTGPPYFKKVLSMAAERGEIPNTLTFLIPRGGPVWDFNLFIEISHLLANYKQIQGRPS